MNTKKHLILIKVDNKPGVLSRITGLFTRRAYNIESLVTGRTMTGEVYHITVSVIGTDDEVALLCRQLERVLEVIDVKSDVGGKTDFISRELVLVRVSFSENEKPALFELCRSLDMRVVGVKNASAAIVITGDESAVSHAIEALGSFNITEILQSGTMALNL